MKPAKSSKKLFVNSLIALCVAPALIGCNQEEKVLDVETPAGEVEVIHDKSNDTVKVDVDDN